MQQPSKTLSIGEIWSINKLIPWEKNPRSITNKDFDRLKKQITKLGVYKPLLVNQDGIIVGGNMRFKALVELGQKEVWVSVVQTNDEADMLEFALSDNDRAGSYEETQLAELATLLPIDLDLFKIDTGKLMPLKDLVDKYGPAGDEPEVPQVDEKSTPVSNVGEIYELGPHKLMCGDATNEDDVRKLCGEQLVDMIFTDPPYNVDYEDKNNYLNEVGKGNPKTGGIANDKMDDTEFYDFLYNSFANMRRVSKKGAVIYVCHADSQGLAFRQAFKDAGWTLKQCLIWVKNFMVLGRQDYQWKHEPILYGWAEGARHYFVNDRKQTTIWEINKPSSSDDHPTMKPLPLINRALRNSTKQDDIVLDLFGGSGSTLIACEQAGRRCFMMETDPKYCDVIRKRYKLFMGASENN